MTYEVRGKTLGVIGYGNIGAQLGVLADRATFALYPWSMADVFIVGVIASLGKIAGMASVAVGIGFWAYAAFAVCFAAMLSSLDRFTVWNDIQAVQKQVAARRTVDQAPGRAGQH